MLPDSSAGISGAGRTFRLLMRRLAVIILLLTSACNKESASGGTGDKAEPATPATSPASGKVQESAGEPAATDKPAVPTNAAEQEAAEDQAIGAKLNPYIDCLNAFSNKVHEARDRYFYWVDETKGLTGKESPKYGTYTLSSPAACKKGVDAVKSENPDLPELEKAGEAYVALLEQLEPLHQQIYDYYEKRDYTRARSLFELAVKCWQDQETPKPPEQQNLLAARQVLNYLAVVEDRAGHRESAVQWLEAVKRISPNPGEIEKRIQEVSSWQPQSHQ